MDPVTGARLQTLLQQNRPRGARAELTSREGAGELSKTLRQERQQSQQQLNCTTGAKRSAVNVQRAAERGKPASKQGKASSAPAPALKQDVGQAAPPQPDNGASPHAETGQLGEYGCSSGEPAADGGTAARAPRRAHHVEAEASSSEAEPAEERAHNQQGCLLDAGSPRAAAAGTGPDAEQDLEPWPGTQPGAKPGSQLGTELRPDQWPGAGPQPTGESEAEPSAERCPGEPQHGDEPGPDAGNGPHGAADSNGDAHDQRQEESLLFCLPQLGMWTKLRPFVRAFLDQVGGLYGLHVTADLMLQAADAASIEWQDRCLRKEAMLWCTPDRCTVPFTVATVKTIRTAQRTSLVSHRPE